MIAKRFSVLHDMAVKAGYVFSYFLFTTILYYILVLMHKLPKSWSYFHIMGITIALVLIGLFLKKILT